MLPREQPSGRPGHSAQGEAQVAPHSAFTRTLSLAPSVLETAPLHLRNSPRGVRCLGLCPCGGGRISGIQVSGDFLTLGGLGACRLRWARRSRWRREADGGLSVVRCSSRPGLRPSKAGGLKCSGTGRHAHPRFQAEDGGSGKFHPRSPPLQSGCPWPPAVTRPPTCCSVSRVPCPSPPPRTPQAVVLVLGGAPSLGAPPRPPPPHSQAG